MKKTFRKRKLEEEDAKEEEGDALEVDIMRQVAEAKKRQKLRSKQVLEAGKAQGKKPQEKPEEEEKYGLQENDTFSKQFKESSTPWSGIEHDDKMREYIERKLLEHRGSSSVLPNGTEDEVAQPKTIDELALEGHGHEDVRLTTEPIEDANRWLTGIQEVQLPIEYKIRNIEDTEEARKKALLAARLGKDAAAQGAASTGGLHSRFVVGQQIRGIAQIADQTKSLTDRQQQGAKLVASDDAVYARYVSDFLAKVSASKDRAVASASSSVASKR